MTLYITSEPVHRLKNAFKSLKQYKLIDVDDICEVCRLDKNNDIHGFIIDQEIHRMMKEGSNQKKFVGIVYLYSNIDEDVVDKVRNVAYSIEDQSTVDIIIMDDYDVPKLRHLYKCVDQVMFFPTFKKMKILKCKPIRIPKS